MFGSLKAHATASLFIVAILGIDSTAVAQQCQFINLRASDQGEARARGYTFGRPTSEFNGDTPGNKQAIEVGARLVDETLERYQNAMGLSSSFVFDVSYPTSPYAVGTIRSKGPTRFSLEVDAVTLGKWSLVNLAPWAARLVVAHEVAHAEYGHVHTTYAEGRMHDLLAEAQADHRAGEFIAKTSVFDPEVVENVAAFYRDMQGPHAGKEHPGSLVRTGAFLHGYLSVHSTTTLRNEGSVNAYLLEYKRFQRCLVDGVLSPIEARQCIRNTYISPSMCSRVQGFLARDKALTGTSCTRRIERVAQKIEDAQRTHQTAATARHQASNIVQLQQDTHSLQRKVQQSGKEIRALKKKIESKRAPQRKTTSKPPSPPPSALSTHIRDLESSL